MAAITICSDFGAHLSLSWILCSFWVNEVLEKAPTEGQVWVLAEEHESRGQRWKWETETELKQKQLKGSCLLQGFPIAKQILISGKNKLPSERQSECNCLSGHSTLTHSLYPFLLIITQAEINKNNARSRKSKDLTEAEEIKKRWQEYTEELYKKGSLWPG